jgi:hypothetical protein
MAKVEQAHSLPPEVGGELVQARRKEHGAATLLAARSRRRTGTS